MTMLPKLQTYLEAHHVNYEILNHQTAYTAQEMAAVQHIPGKEVAKVVMVKKEDGAPVMLVLPASYRVDFTALREVMHASIVLEQEQEFRALFPGCETGAEPPFGNLFDLETVVDAALTRDETIVFNAGSHWQSVRMRYEDFAQLVHPRVATFAHPAVPLPPKNPYDAY
jgi:Ala-tRNA(Pro) deacylase